MRALCCLLLVCGVAAAEPRIEVTGLGSRAIETIRIQLSDIDADVTISIERASVGELVVTVVSEHGTIVRTIEIANGRRDDVDHAIALKIADLVEQAIAMKPLAISAPLAIEFPVAMPAIEVIEHPVVRHEKPHSYIAELGIDMQTALHAGGGIAWRCDHVVLETVASIRARPETELAVASGRMSIADTNAMVGMRVFTTHSIIAVGAHADVGVRRLDVSGASSDGRMGEARTYLLAASPGVDVRWLMTPRLEVRAAVSALLTFDRPVFSLDGTARADVAAPSAVTTMSIVFLAP